MPIRLIAFDVGEVLVDETRHWSGWADWLGVSCMTFGAALGAVIAQRRHHRDAFDLLRPGFDLAAARRERGPQGRYAIGAGDLYPDALPCLARLRATGYRVAIAGNQPRAGIEELRRLGLAAEIMASPEEWGVEKPAVEFFACLAEAARLPPRDIAYVGDRLDNDVLPAMRAGMTGIFLRRGPWGIVHATWPEAARADLRIETLAELPDAVSRLMPPGGDAR